MLYAPDNAFVEKLTPFSFSSADVGSMKTATKLLRKRKKKKLPTSSLWRGVIQWRSLVCIRSGANPLSSVFLFLIAAVDRTFFLTFSLDFNRTKNSLVSLSSFFCPTGSAVFSLGDQTDGAGRPPALGSIFIKKKVVGRFNT